MVATKGMKDGVVKDGAAKKDGVRGRKRQTATEYGVSREEAKEEDGKEEAREDSREDQEKGVMEHRREDSKEEGVKEQGVSRRYSTAAVTIVVSKATPLNTAQKARLVTRAMAKGVQTQEHATIAAVKGTLQGTATKEMGVSKG